MSTEAQRARLLDAPDWDSADYGTVILESLDRGYARVRREKPDMVIVYLAIEDPAVCRLLSMLRLDPETSGIPVVTWAERFDGGGLGDMIATQIPELSKGHQALSVN